MTIKVLKDIVVSLFSVFVFVFFIFLTFDFLPGNAADVIVGTGQAEKSEIINKYNLDKNTFQKYFLWIKSLVSNDWGNSYISKESVHKLIKNSFKVTFPITMISITISIVLGIIMAVFMIINYKKISGKIMDIFSNIIFVTPPVILGIVFMLLFIAVFKIFPYGYDGTIKSLILPSITVGIIEATIMAKIVFRELQGIENSEMIKFSMLQGNSRTKAFIKHGILYSINIIIPIINLQVGFLISGIIIIENVFLLPGMGSLIYDSILQRDIPVAINSIFVLLILMSFISILCKNINLFFNKR